MKATEAQLLNLLKETSQFVIPIYQRRYSWGKPECRQLWDDILRAGSDDSIANHFIGFVVYIKESAFGVMKQPPVLIIDGQQRLTTVSLIIELLARKLGDSGQLPDGFLPGNLRKYYLLNPHEKGEYRYKLLLNQTDKQTLLSIIDWKNPMPEEPSLRIKANFDFFKKQVDALGDNFNPLYRGLAKLMVLDISLERDKDNPQRIFESINSTGRELSQVDLIRNFVLMELEPDHQTKLYNDHWRPMEITFGQKHDGKQFKSFMRHYLTAKTGEAPQGFQGL